MLNSVTSLSSWATSALQSYCQAMALQRRPSVLLTCALVIYLLSPYQILLRLVSKPCTVTVQSTLRIAAEDLRHNLGLYGLREKSMTVELCAAVHASRAVAESTIWSASGPLGPRLSAV